MLLWSLFFCTVATTTPSAPANANPPSTAMVPSQPPASTPQPQQPTSNQPVSQLMPPQHQNQATPQQLHNLLNSSQQSHGNNNKGML